jgi:hypothetical protein
MRNVWCHRSVTFAWGLLAATVAAAPVLVEDGTPRATLVVSATAGETTRHAVAELAAYLRAMSGAELPVVEEGGPVAGVPFRVGLREGLGVEDTAFLDAHPEGSITRVAEDSVAVCGGSERGTLFGAYRFLEEHLGCRWLAPKLDLVPERRTVALTPGRTASAPVFEHRFFGGGNPDSMAWGLKVGLNGYYSAESAARNGQCFYLPAKLSGCHTYNRVIPPDTYFGDHPEWFPLLAGKRTPNTIDSGQLCVTAAGLADEFARNITALFDADPQCRITSISPNDGYGWCECERCLKLDRDLCGARTTRQGLSGDKPFMGDRVFWFANEVARRVAVNYPDRLLLVLAYVNYAEPPDTVRPLPNVVPYLCHYAPADYAHAIADAASEPNAQFEALLRRWAGIAPHLQVYSYVSKSMWWRLPRPVLRTFAEDIRHYRDLGIRRYYCQSSLNDWGLDGPLYYVIARLLWDPGADPQALAADWTAGMFGAAGPALLEYYAAVEAAVRTTGKPYSDNPPYQVPGLYAAASLDRADAALARAAQLADSAAARERVKAVTTLFAYGRHLIRAIEAASRYRETADVDAALTARREGDEALALYRNPDAARFLESLRVDLRLGVITQGFGQSETKGGRECWNSDETGPGDGRAGWASATVRSPLAADAALTVVIDVWGESALESIVINSDGTNRATAAGGVWTPVRPETPLSGRPQWDTLVFRIPPEALARERPAQRLGFGGGDSQIWISRIRVE